MQAVLRLAGEKPASKRADAHAQDHDREHPGRFRLKLRDEKAQVTREHGDGDLHDVIAGDGAEAQPRVASERDAQPHDPGAERHPHEEREDLQRRLVVPFRDLVEQREDDDRGAVVHERLALDDVPQPFRRADFFEQSDHSHGVRRAQDASQHQRRAPAPAVREYPLEDAPQEQRPEEHAGAGEPKHLRRAPSKRVPLERKR
mmetsp:Transcript_13358/g.47909  ORF Transcript_13358/g.47909 Transcript_13358/m.47909 type:complete len:202 (-) Transcript_13358:608-1213(-)|eukprot:30979-Pelagococcus_subviridis.AAC.2